MTMPIYTPDSFRGRTICDVDAQRARSRGKTAIAYFVLSAIVLIGPSVACAIVQHWLGY